MDDIDIPVLALIVDEDQASAVVLDQELRRDPRVHHVKRVTTLTNAVDELGARAFNAIFIDPLSYDLDAASQFIFRTRESQRDIVFVLFVDSIDVDARRNLFFKGDRYRFEHYYTLDKRTPVAAFSSEVRAEVSRCIGDLRWRMSEERLQALRELVTSPRRTSEPDTLQAEVAGELDRVLAVLPQNRLETRTGRPKVFISHRFEEADYVDGLTQLLNTQGFEAVVGTRLNTYVSQGVLQRIANSDYFLCLMTCDQEKVGGNYATSSWILEEKGAALALRKTIVMLVEHGVDDVGGLQGDWQVIRFAPKGFTKAAIQAIDQLKSYLGTPASG